MFPQQRLFCPGSIIWQIRNINAYRAYKMLVHLTYECGQAQGPAGSLGYQALFQNITSAWLSFTIVWSLPCHVFPLNPADTGFNKDVTGLVVDKDI